MSRAQDNDRAASTNYAIPGIHSAHDLDSYSLQYWLGLSADEPVIPTCDYQLDIRSLVSHGDRRGRNTWWA